MQLVHVSEPPLVCPFVCPSVRPASILLAGVDVVEAQVGEDGGPGEYREHASICREGDGAELELLVRG